MRLTLLHKALMLLEIRVPTLYEKGVKANPEVIYKIHAKFNKKFLV